MNPEPERSAPPAGAAGTREVEVAVVGGGLAGLACARRLTQSGREVLVLEAADRPGGRVRTDVVDGYRLDRGFQVLPRAYPTTSEELDLERLDLRPFEPGALVRYQGGFHRVADPFRRPGQALETLFAPFGSLADKARIARMAWALRRSSVSEVLQREEAETARRLRDLGFSSRFIGAFFRPFLGGVFLDPDLTTSSRMFEFVFKMFSAGHVCVPAAGMGEIPAQIAADLPPGTVRTSAPVAGATESGVVLESGERLRAQTVVVATDGPTAQRIAGVTGVPPYRPVLCVYFSATESPVRDGTLVLDGEGTGPVRNLAVMSRVSRSYAPEGRELISATVLRDRLDEPDLDEAIRRQLSDWYGPQVERWEEVGRYRIDAALPDQSPTSGGLRRRPTVTDAGVVVCGDHRTHGSIEGAIESGLLAADAVEERLSPPSS